MIATRDTEPVTSSRASLHSGEGTCFRRSPRSELTLIRLKTQDEMLLSTRIIQGQIELLCQVSLKHFTSHESSVSSGEVACAFCDALQIR